MSADEVSVSLQTMNSLRCKPPLPEEEVTGISIRIGKYAADPNDLELKWRDIELLPPISNPVPTLDDALLPNTLRTHIADIAERVCVPTEFVATPMIVAASSLVGRQIGIQPRCLDDWLVVPNLWGAIVGRPGVMKTAAINEATRPLDQLVADARQEYEENRDEVEANKIIIEVKIAVAKDGAKKAAKNEDVQELDTITKDVTELKRELREANFSERRFVTQDATAEKLGELLIENPNGLLVLRDELSGMIRSFSRQGREGEKELLLEGWNGTGAFTYDRIGRGTLHIPAVTLSIFGGIQPGKLKSIVAGAIQGSEADDGLLQRFQLLVWPDSTGEWRNVDRWPNTEAREKAFAGFAGLVSLKPKDVGAVCEGKIPALRFAPAAQESFDNWRSQLENRLRSDEFEGTPAFESHLSKYRSLMPSLALLFHLLAIVDGCPNGVVSYDAAELSIRWCEFLEAHARKVFAAELNGDTAAAHALFNKIQVGAVTDEMTVREIAERDWSGLAGSGKVHAALDGLEQCNIARRDKRQHPTGGRPSNIIRIHPDLRKK